MKALIVVVGLLLLLGAVDWADAQNQPGSAEVKRVTGRVEVLKKGQTQWLPVVLGAKLVEGDDVRAFSGASAELQLPDGSTLLVAENSRIVLTKLDFDQTNQSRVVLVHLAVGKVIASLTQGALTLVRARQSNFAITTPTSVAAARGTQYEVLTDAGQTRVAVLAEDQKTTPAPWRQGSYVECIPLGQPFQRTTVLAGYVSLECGPPTSILAFPDVGTLRWTPVDPSAVAGVIASPAVTAPPLTQTLNMIGQGIAPQQVLFLTVSPDPPPTPLAIRPTTFAADTSVTVSASGTGIVVSGF
jgi:hypothetical protein